SAAEETLLRRGRRWGRRFRGGRGRGGRLVRLGGFLERHPQCLRLLVVEAEATRQRVVTRLRERELVRISGPEPERDRRRTEHVLACRDAGTVGIGLDEDWVRRPPGLRRRFRIRGLRLFLFVIRVARRRRVAGGRGLL